MGTPFSPREELENVPYCTHSMQEDIKVSRKMLNRDAQDCVLFARVTWVQITTPLKHKASSLH